MNYFSKYINSLFEVGNSTLLYWPSPKKKFFYKTSNLILGYYKDSFIKEKTYFSNDGLRHSLSFNRKFIVNNLSYSYDDLLNKRLFPKNKYFDNKPSRYITGSFFFNDNVYLKLDIFPVKYFKENIKKLKEKQRYFSNIKNFKLKQNTIKYILPHAFLYKQPLYSHAKKIRKQVAHLKKIFYNKKFINMQFKKLKMLRKDWFLRRKNYLFITKWGFIRAFPKRRAPKLSNYNKFTRKAKRWMVRVCLKKFLKLEKFFLQFSGNLFSLKYKSKAYIRNMLLYLVHLKAKMKMLRINLMFYIKGRYRYIKRYKKKVLWIKNVGSSVLNPKSFYYPFATLARNLRISWAKIFSLYIRLIIKLYRFKNLFFQKQLWLKFFFNLNSKFNFKQTFDLREKWLTTHFKLILAQTGHKYKLFKYNLISSLLFSSNSFIKLDNVIHFKALFLKNFIDNIILSNIATQCLFYNNDTRFFKLFFFSWKKKRKLNYLSKKQEYISNLITQKQKVSFTTLFPFAFYLGNTIFSNVGRFYQKNYMFHYNKKKLYYNVSLQEKINRLHSYYLEIIFDKMIYNRMMKRIIRLKRVEARTIRRLGFDPKVLLKNNPTKWQYDKIQLRKKKIIQKEINKKLKKHQKWVERTKLKEKKIRLKLKEKLEKQGLLIKKKKKKIEQINTELILPIPCKKRRKRRTPDKKIKPIVRKKKIIIFEKKNTNKKHIRIDITNVDEYNRKQEEYFLSLKNKKIKKKKFYARKPKNTKHNEKFNVKKLFTNNKNK